MVMPTPRSIGAPSPDLHPELYEMPEMPPPNIGVVVKDHEDLADKLTEAAAGLRALTKAVDAVYGIGTTTATPESEAAGLRRAFRKVNNVRESQRVMVLMLRRQHDDDAKSGKCPSDCLARTIVGYVVPAAGG